MPSRCRPRPARSCGRRPRRRRSLRGHGRSLVRGHRREAGGRLRTAIIGQHAGQIRQGDPVAGRGAAAVGEHFRGLARRVTEGGDDQRRFAEVLVGGEVVHGDHAGQAGFGGGHEAVPGVLHHDDLAGRHAELLAGEQVDIRGWFLVGDDVAGENRDRPGPLGADGPFQGRPNRDFRGGRGDGEGPARVERLGGNPRDARPGRDSAGSDQTGVDLRLPPVPGGHRGLLPLPDLRANRRQRRTPASAGWRGAPCRRRCGAFPGTQPRSSAPGGRTPRRSG